MLSTPSTRSRRAQLEALGNNLFDVVVLGGGITGITAAHELTARGYRVALIDNHDFASGTSQESSQLIWGGIKYLERGHVRLVTNLCRERNALVERYPRRVMKQRFLYPRFGHDPHFMASILAGSYAYWLIGKGFGKPPLFASRSKLKRLVPKLRAGKISGGLEYSDARAAVSDARFSLDLLFDAVDTGLTVGNYIEVSDFARARNGDHALQARDTIHDRSLKIRARWIVNCTGCWVDEVNRQLGVDPPHRLLFSKGIHLIVPRIETHGRALTCLGKDGRIFFVIPWGKVTLIGTTDTRHDAPPTRVRANEADIEYLRRAAEAKLDLTFADSDILNTKAGLRPLVRPKVMRDQDFLALARSHKVWSRSKVAVTALWGGKFTDAFSMAREIADTIRFSPSLSEGEIPPSEFISDFSGEGYGESENAVRASEILCEREMVTSLEDLLRRRTNIALKIANLGWGRDGEHEPQIRALAGAVGRAEGLDAEKLVADYRGTTRMDAEIAAQTVSS